MLAGVRHVHVLVAGVVLRLDDVKPRHFPHVIHEVWTEAVFGTTVLLRGRRELVALAALRRRRLGRRTRDVRGLRHAALDSNGHDCNDDEV